MSKQEFFPVRPGVQPLIYAYKDRNPNYQGLLKIGYTTSDVEKRISQQYPIIQPFGKPYTIVFKETAMYEDGSVFTDHDIHKQLRKRGYENPDGEWFRCTVEDLKAVYLAVKLRQNNLENRTLNFTLRPEQEEAIQKTISYFQNAEKDKGNSAPKFLWNAKMRFGKTFASYQLAKRMNFKRILILTFKPAVEQAWNEDLQNHIDFEGWQYISNSPGELNYENADKNKPIVCFGSFQDFLGVNKETGSIKVKNEWVHTTNWDLVIFDEYHFGAWRDNAKKLFEDIENEDNFDNIDIEKYKEIEEPNAYNESFLPITTRYYLFLSGTPFRAINSGEFIEDQIYNWTYSDEQKAKETWSGPNNPYRALPRMVLMTYRIPDDIRNVALQGEFNEFDLNVFFSAKGKGESATFIYENEVQKWLNLIRGAHLETSIDELKLGALKPVLPFQDQRLLNILTHTLWFLPNVSSCYAMANLLKKRQNVFYHDYRINVAAGTSAGIGLRALEPVQKSMNDPLKSKTITLSCGKLTTGVTIKPWSGIFMLRNLSSPETYFQAAFRVQSPWEIDLENGQKEILKHECYVFDFAIERALKQISDYSTRLNINETNPERKVEEFINFLPVLAYDGSAMISIDAAGILDLTMAGTSASLLARRWQSAFLVNVDDSTLKRLMSNHLAMEALSKIEGFRNLRSEIETIISKSDAVKKAKKEPAENLDPKEKKKISDDEKEYKSKRKQIQEKLIKFATRIPIFMYLSEYREYSLKDVITKLEPPLFTKVTGLNIEDFELLISLGVFNESVMNDAIYKFKRYEDSSLNYTGINKHAGESVGLFNTVLSNYDYLSMMQQESLVVNKQTVAQNVEKTNAVKRDKEPNLETHLKKAYVEPAKDKYIKLEKNEQVGHGSNNSQVTINKFSNEEIRKIKVGTITEHDTFGTGVVVSKDSDYVVVKFDIIGVKKFRFPSVFVQGYLKLKDN